MGNARGFCGREADFREPFAPTPVNADGAGLQRRPAHAEAYPQEEARNETRPTAQTLADTVGGSGSPCRSPGQGPESSAVAPPSIAELASFPDGADAALSTPKRCRTRIVDLPRVTIEEVDANIEEQRAMMEALRLLARWICRLPHEKAVRERKAA